MDYHNLHPIDTTRVYLAKYPKFLLLFITFMIAYLLFYGRDNQAFHDIIISTGYLGIFIAGLMFSYGFTTAPAISLLFIMAGHQNMLAATLIGGLGASISDLIIFRFIRVSFADEVEKLSKEKLVVQISSHTPGKFKKYFLPVLAGFIIASPLPDEIGVAMLASIRSISTRLFTLISYTSNTLGIFIILTVGNLIS